MTLRSIDVSRLIDDRPISGLQVLVLVLSFLMNLLDGADTQSIGVAAPFIVHALHIRPALLGIVFSAALLGAALGAIGFGALSDRIGRRPLLIASMLIIGAFTLLTAHATSLPMLLAVRFVAGIGLGGATPCFIALSSEYAPRRSRSTYVTLMWAGFPLGGMVGGFANSLLIPGFGWRAIFYVGGVLPLLLAAVLVVSLPESLKVLVGRRPDRAGAVRVLRRMRVEGIGDDTLLTVEDERLPGSSLRLVFADGRAAGTLMLWAMFFIGFGVLTVAILWMPSLLRLHGIRPASTAFVVAFNGLGAFFGMSAAGRLLGAFGTVRILVPAFAFGAAVTGCLGYGAGSVPVSALFIGLNGLFVGGAAAGVIALAAEVYPTAIRSTGVGLGMAVGRFGQMVGPLLVGGLLGAGWSAGPVMAAVGAATLLAAGIVILFGSWTRRRSQPADPALLDAPAS